MMNRIKYILPLALLLWSVVLSQAFTARRVLATTTLVSDSFARTNTDSWGSTSPGGAYTLSGSAADFDVSQVGMMKLGVNVNRSAYLTGVSARDVEFKFRIKRDKTVAEGVHIGYFIARRASEGNNYLARIRYAKDGSIRLQAVAQVNGANTLIGGEAIVPNVTNAANSYLWLRGQVTGANPTTIRLKAWALGQSEPGSWQYSRTDSTESLQGRGAVGLRAYLGTGAINAPVMFYFDDFSVIDIAASSPTPTAQPPTPTATSQPPTPTPTTAAAAFSFTAVGDYGGTSNTDAVLSGIASAGANFNLALGDLSYGSYAPESAWCNYVQSKVGTSFPFQLGAGNHDMDAQPTGYINNFVACLPNRIGNLTGSYGKQYYFDYNNLARVIFVSPNLTLDGELYSYTVGSPRYTWLANAIDGARALNLPWVIVGMHKNCISTGEKSCEIRADLFNLLVSKKVDLVLQGHDHDYQRSKQLAFNSACVSILPGAYDANCVKDDGSDNTYTQGAGMVLAIVGTGGQSLYGNNPADSEAGYFSKFVLPGDTARYGFLKVSVASDQLSAQFVPVTPGTFGDAFVIR